MKYEVKTSDAGDIEREKARASNELGEYLDLTALIPRKADSFSDRRAEHRTVKIVIGCNSVEIPNLSGADPFWQALRDTLDKRATELRKWQVDPHAR